MLKQILSSQALFILCEKSVFSAAYKKAMAYCLPPLADKSLAEGVCSDCPPVMSRPALACGSYPIRPTIMAAMFVRMGFAERSPGACRGLGGACGFAGLGAKGRKAGAIGKGIEG